MTELLLTAGADVDVRDSSGESALQLAASLGNIDVVRRLLDQGGDPNALGRDTTPLGAAAYQGSPEMVALLLARGADSNRMFRDRASRATNTAVYGAHACARAPQRNNDLRRLNVVSLLLDAGADVDTEDRKGRTVLHLVAAHGDLKAVDLLLSRGAAVNVVDAQGLTPLHLAVREGHAAVAAQLLGRGADVRVKAQGRHHTPGPGGTRRRDGRTRSPSCEPLIEPAREGGCRQDDGAAPSPRSRSSRAR